MCTVRTERRVTPRLTWGRLYGIVLVTVALGLVVDATSKVGALHQLLAELVVVSGFGGILLWVRSNRVALSVADTCDCAAEHLRIRVVESRPATLPRLGREIETPAVLIGTAIAVVTAGGKAGPLNPARTGSARSCTGSPRPATTTTAAPSPA